MTKTMVVWNLSEFDRDQRLERINKALEMQVAGLTDNLPEVTESEGTMTVFRTWTTPAAAEEWVSFVTPMNPISASIVTE